MYHRISPASIFLYFTHFTSPYFLSLSLIPIFTIILHSSDSPSSPPRISPFFIVLIFPPSIFPHFSDFPSHYFLSLFLLRISSFIQLPFISPHFPTPHFPFPHFLLLLLLPPHVPYCPIIFSISSSLSSLISPPLSPIIAPPFIFPHLNDIPLHHQSTFPLTTPTSHFFISPFSFPLTTHPFTYLSTPLSYRPSPYFLSVTLHPHHSFSLTSPTSLTSLTFPIIYPTSFSLSQRISPASVLPYFTHFSFSYFLSLSLLRIS